MSLVEKEITQRNVELANNSPELKNSRERERKFESSLHLLNVRQSEVLEQGAIPIKQIYLSSPDDEFDVRVRCVYKPEGNEYTATVKDRGEVIDGARDRLEVPTPISQESYELYAAMPELARLSKERTEVQDGLTLDYIWGGFIKPSHYIFEVEHDDPNERARLVAELKSMVVVPGYLQEVTGKRQFDSQEMAYEYSGVERKKAPESLDAFTERVLGEMVAQYVLGRKQVVVGLTGMSGSGKTTVAKALQAKITELYGEEFKPIVISTDDYHFGKTRLEEVHGAPYTAWDDAKTYNTEALAFDLQQLAEGIPLIKRHFDFDTEEPALDEELPISPFVIIEGLYADSKDLEKVRDLHFELPTSIATSIGRDVRRLIIENRKNRAFPTAASRLRHLIETAAPMYMEREKPTPKSFSASSRPMAERAFMLARLHEV